MAVPRWIFSVALRFRFFRLLLAARGTSLDFSQIFEFAESPPAAGRLESSFDEAEEHSFRRVLAGASKLFGIGDVFSGNWSWRMMMRIGLWKYTFHLRHRHHWEKPDKQEKEREKNPMSSAERKYVHP